VLLPAPHDVKGETSSWHERAYILVPEASLHHLNHLTHTRCREPLHVPAWLAEYLTNLAEDTPTHIDAGDAQLVQYTFGKKKAIVPPEIPEPPTPGIDVNF
jgi:hypothetical protein